MKNIELKIKINNFGPILKKLKGLSAEYKGVLKQTDTYYKCKNGRLKIREINNKFYELIFYQRPNTLGQKISNYEVIKINDKQLSDFKNILKTSLGEKIKVEKKRSLWIYKNTRIHLDKVKKLGTFLELETMVNDNINKSRDEYRQISGILELKKYKKYKKSYSDILISITLSDKLGIKE